MKLETFFDKFDQFVEAPNAITKIRELLLELAVTGKLSSPFPGDLAVPSCQDLNKQVFQLSASLGLRAQKETSEEVESPFEVPEHWRWLSLGDIGVSQTGTTPSKNDHEAFNGEIPFIKPADIFPDVIRYDNESLTRQGAESGSRLAPAGSLLMVCIGTIGKCNLIDRECSFNQQINSITPVDAIDPRFLLFAVRARYFQKLAWKKSSSTTIAIINKGKWVSIPVPVPPLAEQKRIVAKVDELMALCDRLEAQQQKRDTQHAALSRAALSRFADAPTPANLNFLFHPSYAIAPANIRKAILNLAVQGKLVPQDPYDQLGEKHLNAPKNAERNRPKWAGSIEEQEKPFQLPSSWKWFRLGELSSLKHGYAFSSEFFTSEPAPFVLTTPGNFYEKGGFRDRESKRKYYSGTVDPEFIFKPDDLIIPMTEQAAGLLGSPAFIPDDGRVYIHNQRLGKLSFSEAIAPEFAFWFFNCEFFRGELSRTCTGMKVRHTSPDRILKVPFPVCPLAEQRRIVAKVDQLMTLVDQLEAQLAASRAASIKLVEAVIEELTALE